ncbi:MAG: hypothetical protein PHG77_12300 [Proteiniphilum sp.]|nr:hypothetical protein [Proteiniphilum sp.]
METITDTKYVYTTLASGFDHADSLQKTAVIEGHEGKQIKIEELSCSMNVAKAGVTGTVTVVAEVDGVYTTLATFEEINTLYTSKSVKVDFLAEAGKSVTLRWYIKSSDKKNRARMKLLSYSYNIVDAPEKPPVKKTNDCLVVVECESENAANLLVEALRGSGYLERGAEIYIKESA